MDAAFTLADEDKSGTVDVFEFVRLFSLIKAGKVKGLGKRNMMSFSTGKKDDFKKAFSGDGAAFVVGDAVSWKKCDEDLPVGTVGQVSEDPFCSS